MSVPHDYNYKLMAYNTSFVNDCHENQFHPGLSESASIIAKYVKKYYNSSYDDFLTNLNENGGIENYKSQLTTFRLGLANTSTDYIKGKLEGKYDFIALIEQSMHVYNTNHASYGMTQAKMDLGNDNVNYGFLLRLNKLTKDNDIKIIDIDEKSNHYGNGQTNYNVVYDNVVNTGISAGEGIAIIYKSELVQTFFTWEKSTNPNNEYVRAAVLKARAVAEAAANTVIGGDNASIHYYSDDLGRHLCHEVNNKNKLRYVKENKTTDYGRPIIITGGMKDNKMVLFVAVHGPNIMNLCKVTKYDKDNNPENIGRSNKLIYTEGTKEEKQELINFYNIFIKTITDIINEAIKKITENNPNNIKEIELFLGGDFNDPTGQLLETLIKDGIKITVSGKLYNIHFNYTLKKEDQTGNLQGRYTELDSCCANADSLKKKLQILDPISLGLLQPMTTTDKYEEENKNNFIARVKKIKDKYPIDFDIPNNFGYNGDYALFGVGTPEYTMKLDKALTVTNPTEPSDHLLVESIVQTETVNSAEPHQGGGKRRTTRKRRKYNKKSRKV